MMSSRSRNTGSGGNTIKHLVPLVPPQWAQDEAEKLRRLVAKDPKARRELDIWLKRHGGSLAALIRDSNWGAKEN